MLNQHRKRIKQVQSRLREENHACAAIFSSGPEVLQSRDTHFPFRQDSDFYYLTGSHAKGLVLFFSNIDTKPILYSPTPDKQKIVWEGKGEEPSAIASALNIEHVQSKNIFGEILKKMQGKESLYFQNTPDTPAWRIARGLIEKPSYARGTFPASFQHTDLIMESLRLFKDKHEVALIRKAAKATGNGLHYIAKSIQPGLSERQVRDMLEYEFKKQDCSLAFNTIVASGPSAATLHYEKHDRKLGKEDLLLIDCGAAYKLYASDITRVLPVKGSFAGVRKEVYEIVLDAQLAALSKVKHRARIATVYNAAAKVLTEGLKELKVLKGSTEKLIKDKAFKPFFPHGIGHSLGLDTHDIGNFRGNTEAVLEKGMVFTIEPGLYFSKKTGKIPACGVRIEDDVLVTEKGCEILTADFPNATQEIESLMGY